jgi:hypothetical protein
LSELTLEEDILKNKPFYQDGSFTVTYGELMSNGFIMYAVSEEIFNTFIHYNTYNPLVQKAASSEQKFQVLNNLGGYNFYLSTQTNIKYSINIDVSIEKNLAGQFDHFESLNFLNPETEIIKDTVKPA